MARSEDIDAGSPHACAGERARRECHVPGRICAKLGAMTTRADFTDEESEILRAAPWAAGLLVVYADVHITGMVSEFQALWDSLRMPSGTGEAEEFVTSLVDAMTESEDDPDSPRHDEDLDKDELLDLITTAARLVDERCTRAEADGYREWITRAARATAEASREGWFFGVGGPLVSDREATAMAEIESALGRSGSK